MRGSNRQANDMIQAPSIRQTGATAFADASEADKRAALRRIKFVATSALVLCVAVLVVVPSLRMTRER